MRIKMATAGESESEAFSKFLSEVFVQKHHTSHSFKVFLQISFF